jgi:ADP-ribose pyrophosphatase YjhB (NUDIX family)
MSGPRPTALALITEQDRILLLRMVEDDGYEYWAPPGGGLLAGETLPRAAAREALEETGIRVRIGPVQYVHDFINPVDGCHKVEVYFRASPVADPTPRRTPHRDRRIQEVRWISLSEVRTLTTFPIEFAEMLPRDLASGAPAPARYF